ncbi:hypothetical protein NX059_012072 [Plenodomus lindquistii]|nr:hypothetical protein NX059_012072 [Plenodomus lindquistii]
MLGPFERCLHAYISHTWLACAVTSSDTMGTYVARPPPAGKVNKNQMLSEPLKRRDSANYLRSYTALKCPLNITMAIETALQRADQFIVRQMHKFDQQKRGRTSPPRAYAGYGQLPPQQDHTYNRPPSQSYSSPVPPPHPPQQCTTAPPGWKQAFDTRNQRWYYIDLATGRSQWEPPQSQNTQPPSRAQTVYNEPPQHREQNRWSQQRARATSQPQRPMSSSSGEPYLGVDYPQRNASSLSPQPSPQGRLPPGAHWDMKTGQMVTDMFPPDQDAKSWAQEVGRV